MRGVFFLAAVCCCTSTFVSAAIWPKPQHYEEKSKVFTVDPNNFRFSGNYKDCPVLKAAVERYGGIIFLAKRGTSAVKFSNLSISQAPTSAATTMKTLQIDLVDDEKDGEAKLCEEWPSEKMDEEYTLKIGLDNSNVGILASKSTWGALRGLETFSQLVNFTDSVGFQVKAVNITDFPRFHYRGLMLDTSRHYLSVSIILQNIQLMEHNKLNVFHWHIVDDESFPYYSKAFPELSEMGAYNSKTHIYTPDDVSKVIEYARIRGIRVIPEFDTPGHTKSWGKGIKDLLTPCYDKLGKVKNYYALNPILNSTYSFLRTFFKEVMDIFKDSYLHLGGDELNPLCWMSNSNLTKFMKDKHMNNFRQLETYYIKKLMKITQSLSNGKHSYLVWEDVFNNGVKLGLENIVHVWKKNYKYTLAETTKAGFRTILSSCWYLNYIQYGSDWLKFYNCDPQDFFGSQKQKDLVLGGEVCMWGEFVDGTNIVSTTWPRASAPAERLWSAEDTKNLQEARYRLNTFSCLLLRRGFNVQPTSGPGHCPDDHLVL